MKIVAPANSDNDILPLIESGASEIYMGYNPKSWTRKYTDIISTNRRYFKESQTTFSKLKKSIKIAKKNNVKINLALNNHSYEKNQYKTLLKLAKLPFDAFIASDLTLIQLLTKKNLNVHVSTGGAAINTEAIKFYEHLGAKRIILPRQLTINEIKAIRKSTKLELEVFMMYDTCKNNDAFCQYLHGTEDLLKSEHGCLYLNQFKSKSDLPQKRIQNLQFPMFCAACHIKNLKSIDYLKIAGRRFPLRMKTKAVSFIKQAIYHPNPMQLYFNTYGRRCPKNNCNYYGD